MLYPTQLLADALAARLVDGYREMFGAREPQCVDFVAVATRLTLQVIGDSDALYHDAHHTALVTMVGQDILRGRMLAHCLEPMDWAHVTLALLLHDIGFVRGVCPGDGPGRCVIDGTGATIAMPRGASDAWVAPDPVERGKIAARAPPAAPGTASGGARLRCRRDSPAIPGSTPSESPRPSSGPDSRCRRA